MPMLRLAVHPGGLPKISSMTAACTAPLITKLRRRSREDADPALGRLIEDVESYLPDEPPTSRAIQPVVSLNLRKRSAARLESMLPCASTRCMAPGDELSGRPPSHTP